MSEGQKLGIISNGDVYGTQVFVGDEPLSDVLSVKWTAGVPGEFATAEIVVRGVALDATLLPEGTTVVVEADPTIADIATVEVAFGRRDQLFREAVQHVTLDVGVPVKAIKGDIGGQLAQHTMKFFEALDEECERAQAMTTWFVEVVREAVGPDPATPITININQITWLWPEDHSIGLADGTRMQLDTGDFDHLARLVANHTMNVMPKGAINAR